METAKGHILLVEDEVKLARFVELERALQIDILSRTLY